MNVERTSPRGFLDPTHPAYRFVILGCTASLSFGSYFGYDIVAGTANSLIDELKMSRTIVGTMNAMYSIAAIAVVFFGGVLIDRLGTRKASLIFSLLVVTGALIVWRAQTVPWILIGRFVFGAGSEPLIVAQSAMLARWFKSRELALAFGIQLTVSRLGSLFAFNTGELFASYFGSVRYALLAAVLACSLSLLGNLLYIFLDRRAERVLGLRDESAGERIAFKDIRAFSAAYWYITFLCLTFYSAIFPFQNLAVNFFVEKWGIPKEAPAAGGFLARVFNNFIHMFGTAGGITSIIIFASMVLAPFAGRLVDRVGKRATLMMAGSLLMIPCHLAMGLTHIYPAYPMALLGFSFVLVPAALWPAVPIIVRPERVGTAFGLMTAIQNVGLGAFPPINGLLREKTGDYTASQVMFAALGVAGLVFSVLLKRADRRKNLGLERPGAART